MKNVLPILLAVWTASLGMLTTATATPINGSFESGGFDGWQTQISRGRPMYQPRHRAAGTAEVVSSWGAQVGLTPLLTAVDGNNFAALGSLDRGNFVGDRTYHSSLNQSLSVGAGDTLSGWAAFYNGDYEPQDAAWVKVLDSDGNLLATPWRENSGVTPEWDFNATPYLTATPWTQWSWAVPASGNYILSLGLTTRGDDNYASYGFFDDIFVVPAVISPVPEPSALALVALGAMAVAGLRRQRK